MSSLKKKTKTTQTTTPNVPDWLATPYKTAATAVGGIQATDPSVYTPTATPDLEKSWSAAANLAPSDYSGAKGLLDGVNYDLSGTSGADFMGKYRDLFSKDVINPVLADVDEQAGQVRAAQAADGARNGAFRGGRFGLREGQTEGELSRARASTYGGLLKDAANFAMAGGQADAGRAQGAQEGNRAARFTGTGLLSDITSRQSSDARGNLDLSNRIAGQHTDFQNIVKQFPLELQGKINGLLAGLNPELFTGSTTNSKTTSSGGLGDIANLIKVASIAAAPFTAGTSIGAGMGAFASDVNLKTDIETIGHDEKGRRWVSWRWKWDAPDAERKTGVIAQEVQKTDPDAVFLHPAGFLMVDYGRLA